METEKIKTIIKAQNSFHYFVINIFCKSLSLFPNGFIDGDYIKKVCEIIQNNKKTARISARDHFKSTSLYAHFMWKLLNSYGKRIEAHYFSYQYGMAAYHINKIKEAIRSNEYFDDLIDNKKSAESIIKYSWDGVNFVTLEPHGLLEFKRGIHAPLLYIDDPFQDPSNKMVLTIINKINDIFKAQILDMVQDEIHVVGTPQTNEDFFFDKNVMSEFFVSILPAIVNEKNRQVLWNEWMNWEKLMQKKKEKGEKLFNQEYLCSPTYAEEAFINKEKLIKLVNNKLENKNYLKKYETSNDVVAGLDIGKKSHPSHLAVFEIVNGKRIQLHQKFMDNWDYIDQVEYCIEAIKNFKIDKLYYDNTRGEFESLKEQNKLPIEMEAINFTLKTKNAMAVQLDTAISDEKIEFLNDKRMLDQMLLVTNDLQAIETPEGHADSFWSIALTFNYEGAPQPEIYIL